MRRNSAHGARPLKEGKVGIYPTYAKFCRRHLEIWLRVASYALSYQLRFITKGKWVWELRKAKQQGAKVAGVHLIQMGKAQRSSRAKLEEWLDVEVESLGQLATLLTMAVNELDFPGWYVPFAAGESERPWSVQNPFTGEVETWMLEEAEEMKAGEEEDE